MRSSLWACIHRKAGCSGRLRAALTTLNRSCVGHVSALVVAIAAGAAVGACGLGDDGADPAAMPPDTPVGSNSLDESPPATNGSDGDVADPGSAAVPAQRGTDAAKHGSGSMEEAPTPGGYDFGFILGSDALG